MKVLTANRLAPGEVVYWHSARGWVQDLQHAELFDGAAADKALAGAADWVERCEVVAPYLFAVRLESAVVVPISAREAIRARGPSVRPDLGKQVAA